LYKCTILEDMEFKFVVDEIHPLKFLYCLKGKLEHFFQNGETINTIEQYQIAITTSPNTNGHIVHFKSSLEKQNHALKRTWLFSVVTQRGFEPPTVRAEI
jgi:hypothetical protein